MITIALDKYSLIENFAQLTIYNNQIQLFIEAFSLCVWFQAKETIYINYMIFYSYYDQS